jgi:hypothetical protein
MTLKIQVGSNFSVSLVDAETTVTTTPKTLLPAYRVTYFNVASAAVATLPDAEAWAAENSDGELLLKDISGAAFTNNITINRAGSNTIDGLTSFVISSNYGYFALRVTPSNNWTFVRGG